MTAQSLVLLQENIDKMLGVSQRRNDRVGQVSCHNIGEKGMLWSRLQRLVTTEVALHE